MIACLLAQTAIGFGLLVAAYAAICWALAAALEAFRRFDEWLTILINRGIAATKRALRKAKVYAIELFKLPFRLTGELVRSLVRKFHTWIVEERKLQALYRDEYAADFESYAAFKKFFKALQHGEAPPFQGKEAGRQSYADDEPSYSEPPKRDPYLEALKVLGLEEPFTQAMFKAVYRTRMKEAHPDITGSEEAARRINAARDLIKEQKGWK